MIYTVADRRIAIHDREDWQDPNLPVTGPAPYPDLVHHFVVHWPGAPDSWKPPLDTAAHLREGQEDYVANKGYSYGYGFVIGVNPVDWTADPVVFDTWEVRGFDIRIASNNGDHNGYEKYKDPNFNGRSVSAQIMSSTSVPASDDQIEQARYLVAIADQVYGDELEVIPHRESDQTSCPGDYICDCIEAIATRPTAGTEPQQPEPSNGDEMSDDDIERIAAKVWGTLFTTNEGPKTAGWIQGQTYILAQRAVRAAEEAAGNTRS